MLNNFAVPEPTLEEMAKDIEKSREIRRKVVDLAIERLDEFAEVLSRNKRILRGENEEQLGDVFV